MRSRQFLTMKDVAEPFKIGEATVGHRMRGGTLQATDFGRDRRIAPRDVEGVLRRHEAAPGP
jgi:hypothetical protein